MSELELWGGAECTVVRVGDRWRDQSHLSGHHGRDDDLDLFAAVGFKAVRYPLLWERVAPDAPDSHDWSWTDARLARLRRLGIRPIAGLVHHGSGPRYTSLLDPDFPAKLGAYAGAVARRYPWIADWTPVNEPLTTARFSGLYGHWYPHHREERSFWTALVNQVDGVAHAMRAVRAVVPGARLIQTDDLGRTYATAPLFHQAAFDNARRWAGWDLLFGRVTPGHPLWDRMAEHGLADRLAALADAPCPPDIVGVNHYPTSDRWLDHRLQRYPAHTHGANFRERFADVEAVRVLDPAPAGLAGALREAWERYRTPVAITEVHLGCTREEQLRWVREAWDAALGLREDGVDVRAATAWAVLGSCGWNTLLTADGTYEAGLFDVGAGAPRPTALAELWRGLPYGAARHPVARAPGWWRRSCRFTYPPVRRPAPFDETEPAPPPSGEAPPLMVVGGGPLAEIVARACGGRGLPFVRALRADAALLHGHRPWAVVDAGGAAPAVPARAAEAWDPPVLRFAHADGAQGSRRDLVIRTGPLFSAEDDRCFASAALRALAAGRRVAPPAGAALDAAFAPWVVEAALDLLIDGATGAWRLAHPDPVSHAELTRALARACGLDERLVDDAPATGGADALAHDVALLPLAAVVAAFAHDWAHRHAGERRAA